MSPQFKLIWIQGTCRGDKISSPQQEFSWKIERSHDGICPRDMSLQHVPSCVPTLKWSWVLRHGSNVVFHMRRIECKLAKRIVFAHLHWIRRIWNTTFDPCLNEPHFDLCKIFPSRSSRPFELASLVNWLPPTWSTSFRRTLSQCSVVVTTFPRLLPAQSSCCWSAWCCGALWQLKPWPAWQLLCSSGPSRAPWSRCCRDCAVRPRSWQTSVCGWFLTSFPESAR